VASYLGLDGAGPGLADVIRDVTLPLEAVVRRRPPFGVWLLPAGRCSSPPYELLNSARFGQLLDEARQRYDYVVLDTPPVVPVLDCRVLAKWVDGIVMVVAAHRTPRKLLQEALESIDRARIAGLVFNHDDRPLWRRYRDRYTYGMYGQDPVRDGNGPGRPGAPSMTPGPGGRRP
jgi:Mrp family chromosome partitioning ATPase